MISFLNNNLKLKIMWKLVLLLPIVFLYVFFITSISLAIKNYIVKGNSFNDTLIFGFLTSVFITLIILLTKLTLYLYV